MQRRSFDDTEFGKSAVLCHTVCTESFAKVRPALPAGPAFPTFDIGVHNHAISNDHILHVRPDVDNDTGELVAGNDGKSRRSVVGLQHFEIGVTDT